jgi:hypothetical protein
MLNVVYTPTTSEPTANWTAIGGTIYSMITDGSKNKRERERERENGRLQSVEQLFLLHSFSLSFVAFCSVLLLNSSDNGTLSVNQTVLVNTAMRLNFSAEARVSEKSDKKKIATLFFFFDTKKSISP